MRSTVVAAIGKPSWDRARLRHDRLALIQHEMERQQIGALYLSDGVHTRYLLDLIGPGVKLFVPVEGEVTAFARPRDIGYVQLEFGNVELGHYSSAELRDLSRDPASRLQDLMARHGVAGEQLGVDILKPRPLLDLLTAGIAVVDAELVCERAASVKTEDEIAMYRAIGEQYVRTMQAFRDAIEPGVTEIELADYVTSTWSQVGGEDVAQLNVCSAENMNPWRRWPTDRAIAEGDFVGIDLHGRSFCGLRGDGSTTFFVGDHPTPEHRDLYRQAHEYLQAATQVLRAGRRIPEVMADQPAIPDRYRAQQHHYHLAHGVGIGPSGYPHMDPRSKPIDDVLRPNQVLSVECYFGEQGSSLAVKLEQQILVRDGKPEIIGSIPLEDRFLG